MSITADIINQVDQVTLGYTAQAYQDIVNSHASTLRLMMVAYFAMFGIAVFKGFLPLTMRQISKHVLIAFTVFYLATNWGVFTTFFYEVFTKGPEQLISAMTGGSDPSEQLSQVFEQGTDAGNTLLNQGGLSVSGVSRVIFGLFVFAATVLMVGYALFLLVFSKLGLAVVLSLGPIFIGLAMWKSTRGLFHSWLNYLINLAFIPIITFSLMTLIMSMATGEVAKLQQAGADLAATQLLAYILIMAISILLFSQVMSVAASLGGGLALSTAGALSNPYKIATAALAVGGAVKKIPKLPGMAVGKAIGFAKGGSQKGKQVAGAAKTTAKGVNKAYQWTRNVGEDPQTNSKAKAEKRMQAS